MGSNFHGDAHGKSAARASSRLGKILRSFCCYAGMVVERMPIYIFVSGFLIFGLLCWVAAVGESDWAHIIVLLVFGGACIFAATFALWFETDLGNLLGPLAREIWQRLAHIIRRLVPKVQSDRQRQKSRLVIQTGINRSTVLGSSLIVLPFFLGGLYLFPLAFRNLVTGGHDVLPRALGAFVILILLFTTSILVGRHRIILDRQRKKVILKRGMLFWFWWKKEFNWDQCTAVNIEEELPYYYAFDWKGRRLRRVPKLLLDGGEGGGLSPNDGRVVYFTINIVCGDEVIPVKDFGFGWTARRLARKVAGYMELPIQDRAR